MIFPWLPFENNNIDADSSPGHEVEHWRHVEEGKNRGGVAAWMMILTQTKMSITILNSLHSWRYCVGARLKSWRLNFKLQEAGSTQREPQRRYKIKPTGPFLLDP